MNIKNEVKPPTMEPPLVPTRKIKDEPDIKKEPDINEIKKEDQSKKKRPLDESSSESSSE